MDPSGRGQGICELIDIPLSEMDLYSSPHSRDENLLYHPDYDYYERDRNACRPSSCVDCGVKPYGPSGTGSGSGTSGGGDLYRPTTYRPESNYKPYPDQHAPPNRYRPPHETALDTYRPSSYDSRPSIYDGRPSVYDSKPPDYDRYDLSGPPPGNGFRPSYGSEDRYDVLKPIEISRPGYQEVIITSDPQFIPSKDYHPNPFKDHYRPDFIPIENYRPSHSRPNNPDTYLGPYRPPQYEPQYPSYLPSDGGGSYRPQPSRPEHYPPSSSGGGSSIYLDRDPPSYRKPTNNFIPYTIGQDNSWGSYGGSYGGSSYSKHSSNYWGLQNDVKRKDGPHFNYFELGGSNGAHGDNSIWSYPGSRYEASPDRYPYGMDKASYGNSWTRRPGPDG